MRMKLDEFNAALDAAILSGSQDSIDELFSKNSTNTQVTINQDQLDRCVGLANPFELLGFIGQHNVNLNLTQLSESFKKDNTDEIEKNEFLSQIYFDMIQDKNIDSLKSFISSGFDHKMPTTQSPSLLQEFLTSGPADRLVEITNLLIEKGVDPNEYPKNFDSNKSKEFPPLQIAVVRDGIEDHIRAELIKTLYENGAREFDFKITYGEAILSSDRYLLHRNNAPKSLNEIRRQRDRFLSKDEQLFLECSFYPDAERIRELIDSGANVNYHRNGKTCLDMAKNSTFWDHAADKNYILPDYAKTYEDLTANLKNQQEEVKLKTVNINDSRPRDEAITIAHPRGDAIIDLKHFYNEEINNKGRFISVAKLKTQDQVKDVIEAAIANNNKEQLGDLFQLLSNQRVPFSITEEQIEKSMRILQDDYHLIMTPIISHEFNIPLNKILPKLVDDAKNKKTQCQDTVNALLARPNFINNTELLNNLLNSEADLNSLTNSDGHNLVIKSILLNKDSSQNDDNLERNLKLIFQKIDPNKLYNTKYLPYDSVSRPVLELVALDTGLPDERKIKLIEVLGKSGAEYKKIYGVSKNIEDALVKYVQNKMKKGATISSLVKEGANNIAQVPKTPEKIILKEKAVVPSISFIEEERNNVQKPIINRRGQNPDNFLSTEVSIFGPKDFEEKLTIDDIKQALKMKNVPISLKVERAIMKLEPNEIIENKILDVAIEKSKMDLVSRMIRARKIDPNLKWEDADTPIIKTMLEYRAFDIVEDLLDAGAKVEKLYASQVTDDFLNLKVKLKNFENLGASTIYELDDKIKETIASKDKDIYEKIKFLDPYQLVDRGNNYTIMDLVNNSGNKRLIEQVTERSSPEDSYGIRETKKLIVETNLLKYKNNIDYYQYIQNIHGEIDQSNLESLVAFAAKEKNWQAVSDFLVNVKNVDIEVDKNSRELLIFTAAQNERFDIVGELVGKGARIFNENNNSTRLSDWINDHNYSDLKLKVQRMEDNYISRSNSRERIMPNGDNKNVPIENSRGVDPKTTNSKGLSKDKSCSIM